MSNQQTIEQIKPLNQKKRQTCGIFSIVNSCRLIIKKSEKEWKNLKLSIINFVKKKYRIHHRGLYSYQIEAMLLYTQNYVKTYWNINLDFTVFVLKDELIHPLLLFNSITKFLKERNRSVLTGLFGSMTHWSCIKNINRKRIYLYDSSGYKYIVKDKCVANRSIHNESNVRMGFTVGLSISKN
ncbi:MAG: hypothetical protein PHG66_04335 [Candidatus Colwellbacteria bacterium]|nr:hypothetical protein [Candidatus Colwellbacteria bacterium]